MNNNLLTALLCLFNATGIAAPPIDIATIKSTLNTRIRNNGYALQKALVDELATRRKAADTQEQIEMRHAQKLLQDECDATKKTTQASYSERKKKLSEQYRTEKKNRKELFTQITKGLSAAKRAAVAPAKTLDMLLDQAASYLSVLHTHAQTAQLNQIVKKAHVEKEWLTSLKDKIQRSSIDLHTPLKKQSKE